MSKTSELFKEAGRSGGLIRIFSDNDLRAHIKNIKCPRHKALIPGKMGYEIEPIPEAKHWSRGLCRELGLKKWRYKKRFGKRIPIPENYYYPEISAAYARERIFEAYHPTCMRCRGCRI